jgi:hypothetical protein
VSLAAAAAVAAASAYSFKNSKHPSVKTNEQQPHEIDHNTTTLKKHKTQVMPFHQMLKGKLS